MLQDFALSLTKLWLLDQISAHPDLPDSAIYSEAKFPYAQSNSARGSARRKTLSCGSWSSSGSGSWSHYSVKVHLN